MDKKAESGKWNWLPAAMPGVQRLLTEKRKALGAAHVAECWKRGVVQGEPGWFFSREGALAVGTPWPDISDIAGWQVTKTQCLVVLREPVAAHGAH